MAYILRNLRFCRERSVFFGMQTSKVSKCYQEIPCSLLVYFFNFLSTNFYLHRVTYVTINVIKQELSKNEIASFCFNPCYIRSDCFFG